VEGRHTRPNWVSITQHHAAVIHWKQGCNGVMQGNGSYHVKRDHITEGDFARFVAPYEMLVDQHRAAPSGQAQDKRPLSCRVEGLDALYAEALADTEAKQGARDAPMT
jgi:hypothetical protein